jgi:predicted transcriptional regulator
MSNDLPRKILLSLRPRHAEAVMLGRKTVEVRRRRIAAPPGTQLVIYATAPTKAVVATATLASTQLYSPDEAWAEHSHRMGIGREELDAYLGGRDACVLVLEDVRRLSGPLTLERLRIEAPFRPPQSYRYLNGNDGALLRWLAVHDGSAPADA